MYSFQQVIPSMTLCSSFQMQSIDHRENASDSRPELLHTKTKQKQNIKIHPNTDDKQLIKKTMIIYTNTAKCDYKMIRHVTFCPLRALCFAIHFFDSHF